MRNIYTILADMYKEGARPDELAISYGVVPYQMKSKMEYALLLDKYPWLGNFSLAVAQTLNDHGIRDEKTMNEIIDQQKPLTEKSYGRRIGTVVCMELSLILGRRITYTKTRNGATTEVNFISGEKFDEGQNKKALKKMIAEMMKTDKGLEKIKSFLEENVEVLKDEVQD